MFAMTKTIEPDVLKSLLMEEAERQKAQQVRRAPKNGKNEDETPNEALGATTNLKPRKGKGRQNVSCWNCGRTGHYSNECKEPPKDNKPKDEPPKESPEMKTAAAVEPHREDCEAWTVESIDDEMDWFESAIAEMDASSCIEDAVSVEIPVRDWFYEVTEDQDESEGLRQDEAPIAHAVESEGEFGGGGTTCESSGWAPDLDVLENPWIDDATMEWRNHAIVLQTVEVEAESRPLGDHKEGEAENDPAAQVREGCYIETITRPLGNHKGGEDDPVTRMPEIECDDYEEYSSVPRFEGEEENTSETRDLPMVPIPGIAAPDPLSAIEISKFFGPKRVSEGREKFFEVPEVVQDVCAVAVFVIYHFEPNFTVGGCLFGQKIIPSMYGIEGLTLDVTIDLERPPGDVFELEGERPCWRMKTSILLISFLDAFVDHVDHVARACYFWYVDSAEGEFQLVSV